jgi:HD-GYP domain-containing protein (c-di-GMP phosphodiesterase class II)
MTKIIKKTKTKETFPPMKNNERLSLFMNEQKNLADGLINIATALNSSLDLEEVLEFILVNLNQVVSYDTANIMLVDEKDGLTARIEATRGYKERGLQGYTETVALKINDVLTLRTMAQSGKPYTVSNTSQDLNWIAYKPTEWIRSYVAAPICVKEKIIGFLNLNSEQPGFYTIEKSERLQGFSEQAGIAISQAKLMRDLQRAHRELEKAYESTLWGWSKALELRDQETEGHCQRVQVLTIKLSCRMGIKDPELKYIKYGALLHDIGKIGIPDSILNKPTSLTDEQWKVMRMHPLYAYKILNQIEYLAPSIDIPYCHHEKWDGSGYPRHLKKEEIPLPARIFSIVDVWDGITSARSYHPPWDRQVALNYIKEQSGKHFDPHVVDVFLKMIGEPDVNDDTNVL